MATFHENLKQSFKNFKNKYIGNVPSGVTLAQINADLTELKEKSMVKRIIHPVNASNTQTIRPGATYTTPALSPAFADTSKVSVSYNSSGVQLQSINSNSVTFKCTNSQTSGYLEYVEIVEYE
jgi:hypothetical protein